MHTRSTHVHHTHLQIIDLDHDWVGNAITRLVLSSNPPAKTHPTWVAYTQAKTLSEAETYVRENGWGAIVINRDASKNLQHALTSDKDTGYDRSSAVSVLISSGRNFMGSEMIALPALISAARMAAANISIELVKSYKSQLQAAPQPAHVNTDVLVSPIWYNTIDVAPYDSSLASGESLFSMLVPLVCIGSIQIMLKASSSELYKTAGCIQLAASILASMLFLSSFFALHASLAVLAFRASNHNTGQSAQPITAGKFFSLFGTYTAVFLACSEWLFFWITLATPDFTSIILGSVVVPSMCSCIVPLEFAPKFFAWFHALPMYNGNMLFRYIVSGAYPRLARNIGILLSEIFAMAVVDVFAVWIRQYWIHNRISDSAGFFRTSIFFKDHFPPPALATEPQEQSDACSLNSSETRVPAHAQRYSISIIDVDDNVAAVNYTMALFSSLEPT
ncbi:hypothetical protein GGI12_003060 [Dipsacomyces acuminosporus]|nr:hypothetical protein GGI12_003060 [Dipsacomyces acuminosporus]